MVEKDESHLSRRLKVGVAQLCSSEDPVENLLLVDAFVQEATEKGCELVCFPENIFYRGPKKKAGFKREDLYFKTASNGELLVSNDFSRLFRDFAESWSIHVSLGSVLEESLDPERPFNSHWLIQPGLKITSYHKIHLFDFENASIRYKESEDYSRGFEMVDAPLKDFRLALSICYDLRFPELYRHLVIDRSCQIILVPAAFTIQTGPFHWKELLKARAIENLSYVIASAQWGAHFNWRGDRLECYGHSLAIDPWGRVLYEGQGRGDELGIVNLDLGAVEASRKMLPSLKGTQIRSRR